MQCYHFESPLAEGLFRRQGVLSDGNGDTTIQNRVTLARRAILDNTLNKSWWHTLPPNRCLLWAIDQKVVTHSKANQFIHTLIKWRRLLINAKATPPSTDPWESNCSEYSWKNGIGKTPLYIPNTVSWWVIFQIFTFLPIVTKKTPSVIIFDPLT